MMSLARLSIRSSHGSLQSSRSIGRAPLFSTSTAAVSKKPAPTNQHQQIVFPPRPTPISNKPIVENPILKVALQDLKKKREEINNLQWLMDKMKIATLPSPVPSEGQSTSQHTFQVMNRNARKAKRANHGKRPCSRDRRRWKTKKWANTSRRG